ncbi:MAG: hypothetical protein KVP17_000628 [Porospora cf. gigantea B]|uniref:uncharacterized protein n=1 Tax=Porospora cf. gigantea B TaxID=2853592 RepID=UPI003571E2AA|nr:MAG: hypothetical protein KVP17_000628 [Porospora cf. gigantea B]
MTHKFYQRKQGHAAQYVTRQQALRRLGMSLPEFRRLCILKGIHPREPKRTSKGRQQTYYHKKDIAFLAREPLIHTFEEIRVLDKKKQKHINRKEPSSAMALEERKPIYALHRLVKERYPSLASALQDLDDCLSFVALFASLQAMDDMYTELTADIVTDCQRLMNEWNFFIAAQSCVRKVFATIKGTYFQVEVDGQTITWLVPFEFPQHIPGDIDFKVLTTFSEFYRSMLRLTMFKLYTDAGLAFPPSSESLVALEKGDRPLRNGDQNADEDQDDEDQEMRNLEADIAEKVKEDKKLTELFKGCVFFLGREVPRKVLSVVLVACGADVVGVQSSMASSCEGQLNADNPSITHHVVDKPPHLVPQMTAGIARDFVQPQWILDSVNNRLMLPVLDYVPGAPCPPHLSPFVDDEVIGYLSDRRKILDELIEEYDKKEKLTKKLEGVKDDEVSESEDFNPEEESDDAGMDVTKPKEKVQETDEEGSDVSDSEDENENTSRKRLREGEVEKPEAEKPEAENSDAENSDAEKSDAEKSDAEKSDAEKSEADKISAPKKKRKITDTERELRRSLMTSKSRWLYDRVKSRSDAKQQKAAALAERAAQLKRK